MTTRVFEDSQQKYINMNPCKKEIKNVQAFPKKKIVGFLDNMIKA